MPQFRNPSNGYIHRVNTFGVFLGCLLFGGFFFLVIGELPHFLGYVAIACLSVFVSGFFGLLALIYPFYAPGIVKQKWLKKGFIQIDECGNPLNGGVRSPQISTVSSVASNEANSEQ
jgi:hypothetical protein